MGKIIYNGIDCGGGGSGTSIEPNPSGAATDTLEKLDIDGTIYDFEGTTYTAGTNIQIVNDVISATDTTYTAGTNIQITNNEISATDTTYSAFQGTDGTEAGSSGLVPAPAASDTNKYLKSDGTWATVSGGGGSGNVDDVYVNGTSVLDSNHIAQITSYKELTQAQYDALPDDKLTDNILYCIKDTGIVEGDKFAPIIYSLNEREVGTWINGKPLYQKTVEFNSPISGSTASLSLGITNVDKIFLCADASSVNNMCPLPYITGNNAGNNIGGFFDITPSDTSFAIRIGSAMVGTINSVIITCCYTKTTDMPGSGKYSALGVPTVHYSTDEQVIGTWIDGKPLYRKTYEVIAQSTWGQGDNIIATIDSVCDVKKIDCTVLEQGILYAMPYLGGNGSFIRAQVQNGNIIFTVYNSSYGTGSVANITLEYTKTTD